MESEPRERSSFPFRRWPGPITQVGSPRSALLARSCERSISQPWASHRARRPDLLLAGAATCWLAAATRERRRSCSIKTARSSRRSPGSVVRTSCGTTRRQKSSTSPVVQGGQHLGKGSSTWSRRRRQHYPDRQSADDLKCAFDHGRSVQRRCFRAARRLERCRRQHCLPVGLHRGIRPPPQCPGPIAGAGLPGLILAGGALLALARRRRSSAAAA